MNEIVKETKLSRDEVLYQLMYIGRNLAYFELIECEVIPDSMIKKTHEYLAGWNAFKQTLIKVVTDEKIRYNKSI